MHLLEERIRRDGIVKNGGVLKVDSFLNHQLDPALFSEMAREFYRLFQGDDVNKILTIEASGIGLAMAVGQVFGCPVLFAKKSKSKNTSDDVYTTKVKSFTHDTVYDVTVSKEYLSSSDRILIIDDFLANGEAISGLIELINAAGATLVGAGVAVEKAFQPGGDNIRARGVRVEALARIARMNEEEGVVFC